MIASALPASVLVSGDVVAQSGDWVVTYDTEHKVAFFVHPVYGPMGISHVTHKVLCHHLPTDRVVVFARKKKNWYDSRMEPTMKQLRWHSKDLTKVNDWRGASISPSEVVSEIARMGGGELAAGIVAGITAKVK